MKTWIFTLQVFHLQFLDWLDRLRRDDPDRVIDTCQFFQNIQKQCGRCSKKIGSLSGDDPSILKFQCCRRCIGFFCTLQCRYSNFAVSDSDSSHIHEQFDFFSFFFRGIPLQEGAKSSVITADDLLTGGLTAGFIITDTVTSHIYPHVGRRFVRT